MENSVLINEKNFEKARSKIRANSKSNVIFSSNDDDLNRKILEKEKINVLLLNQSERFDQAKQRNSGLNQVLAKIAKKKGVTIGINLDEIVNSNKKKKAEILARIRQNINLCKKNNLKMEFVHQNDKNKRSAHDLRALGLVLGMSTSMTKNLE
jgi:RNase P/RNase MRP subunit p30